MKTILSKTHLEVFERIIQDRNGRLFRVRFVVVERDGVLRGKVISVAPITTLQKRFKIYDSRLHRSGFGGQVRLKSKTPCLPACFRFQAVKDKGLKIKDVYFSPYFNKFDFLTVIKIRAPAYAADGRGLYADWRRQTRADRTAD